MTAKEALILGLMIAGFIINLIEADWTEALAWFLLTGCYLGWCLDVPKRD